MIQMLLALFAMITAVSVGLGNSSPTHESIERVILVAGKSGNIPFKLNWTVADNIEVYPYYTLSFESRERPFYLNGDYDPQGFLHETQMSRFTVSLSDLRKGLIVVNLEIADVDILDAAVYVLTLILFDYPKDFHETLRKEVEVRIPRGPAVCEITRSDYSIYLREVHCSARAGEHDTTITCYQNDKKAPYITPVTQSGQLTTGVFWLGENGPFSCCSHDTNTEVNLISCKDFTWAEKEELRLITTPARAGQEIDNVPSSLSLHALMTTNSGSTKQKYYCSVYYMLLFTIIMLVVQC